MVQTGSMGWLDRLMGREGGQRLEGRPAVRRQKNYMSLTGYAYEYFFEGLRQAGGRREYVFTASGDRKKWFPLSVFVPDSGVRDWERAHGRRLEDNERYAAAKMALFEAFDTRDNPQSMAAPVEVEEGQIEELLGRVGVE